VCKFALAVMGRNGRKPQCAMDSEPPYLNDELTRS
jgi:hypothetical protein